MNSPGPVLTPPTFSRFHPLLPFGIAVLALLISLFFHSPRLWVFAHPMPNSTYWERGVQFMLQVENPLGAPVQDPGLVWRLAPALLAHGLGLHGKAALIVPWLGLLVLLTLSASLVLQRTQDRQFAFLTTALLGTTSAVLTVTGWLGMNDAWYASALLAVAFVPGRIAVVTALLVGPWIDERFILAVPLALWVRSIVLRRDWRPRFSVTTAVLAISFYGVIHVLNSLHLASPVTGEYWHQILGGSFIHWLPWTGLGWFMGLRAAWLLVVTAIGGECRRADRAASLVPAVLTLAPMLTITVLASDTSRTTTMLLPLLLLGAERLISLYGIRAARRVMIVLLLANLLMPAMHVTFQSGDIINVLPIEVVRCLRPV